MIEGLLRYHHQRFFVVEVMGARYDVERRSTTVSELHVAYFAGNVVSVLDRIIVRDLRKQSARRAVGLGRSAPALMSHEHNRCARLRVEVDHENSLSACDSQTIRQHHGDSGLSNAASAIGYGDELRHRGLPQS